MTFEYRHPQKNALEDWLPTILTILISSILPIAVVVFIAMINPKGELHEPEKGHLRRSEIWEGLRETEPSEPEKKISEMGKQIRLAFDPPPECAGPGQKAVEMEKLIEVATDPALKHEGTVRKRKLSIAEA